MILSMWLCDPASDFLYSQPSNQRRAMIDRPHHRFRKHLRDWFRLLREMNMITEQEAEAAWERMAAEEELDEELNGE